MDCEDIDQQIYDEDEDDEIWTKLNRYDWKMKILNIFFAGI
jgi:hypothetical protein